MYVKPNNGDSKDECATHLDYPQWTQKLARRRST